MNINAFRYFEVLANTLNMTRAANKLGITQQALSAQVSRLENYYQIQLFSRKPQLELTYAGQRLLEYSQRLNSWNSQMAAEFQEIKDEEKGQIFIGATAKRGFDIFPTVFPLFYKEYPHVEICSVEGSTSSIIQDMMDERTDFCIAVTQINDAKVHSIPILEEYTLLFISNEALLEYCPTHYEYLMKNKNSPVPIEIFKNCPFLLSSSNNRVRNSCDRLFYAHDIIPNTIFSSSNAITLSEIAAQGVGATFLASSTRTDFAPNLHRFQIQDLSAPEIVKISYLRSHYLSHPAHRFIQLAQETLSNMWERP